MLLAMSTKQAKAERPKLLDTLKSLDVAEIDAELTGVNEQISELQSYADKLKAVRKAVDLAVNGKPPRAPRGSKKKAQPAKPKAAVDEPLRLQTGGPELIERIRLYLQHAGTSGIGAIAATLRVEESLVSATCKMNRDIFGWNPRGGGWELRKIED